jgi:hypothetical protein
MLDFAERWNSAKSGRLYAMSPGDLMTNISDSDFDQIITLREAYQLVEAFILQYNARGERSTADLAVDVGICPDGYTSDPAQLDDFLSTAAALLKRQ